MPKNKGQTKFYECCDLTKKVYLVCTLAFASLESLGQDKTFKSLESLVRLFPKVSKVIIFFFWMHKNG